MVPFLCASRSIFQSLLGLASSRKRPSQSDVLGRNLLPRPVPPIGVPFLNAGCGSDIAETAFFHHKNTNMVWPSSSGTQARACMWLANSPLGAWVQNGNRKLANRQYVLSGLAG